MDELLGREFEILDKLFLDFFIMDLDFQILRIKPGTAASLGYHQEDLEGRPLREIVLAPNYPDLKRAFEQTRQAEDKFLYERVYFKKRNSRQLRLHFTIFHAMDDGTPLYVAVGDRKIASIPKIAAARTKRSKEPIVLHKIDKLLHEAELGKETFRKITAILNEAMLFSQYARSIIRFDGEEFSASPLPPGYFDAQITTELVISGEQRGEITVHYLKERAESVSEESELLFEVGNILSNAIERKEIAEKLKQNSFRLQALFDAVTDLVYMTDDEYNLEIVNKKIDSTSKKCYEAAWDLTSPCKDCIAAKVKQTKQPAQVETTVNHKVYLISCYPITDSIGGDITGFLHIVREITKEKEMEQQLIQSDRLASLGQLVSGIAHEINNPNTFIRGNIAIIAEAMDTILPILDQHAADHSDFSIARLPYQFFRKNVPVLLSDMSKGADRIMNIVADLRKFARRDEGLLDKDVDMNRVIESSLRLVHNQIKRTVNVHLDLLKNIPTIRGNVQKMEQVMVNMVINASHAIEKKHQGEMGNIFIRTFVDSANAHLCVHIKDDGTGMTNEVKKRIFDPFFTTKKARQGTGLGLSIAYGIIEEHGGTINVETEFEHGTEFKIVLPLHQEEEEKKGPVPVFKA
jgi:PAS domain S-box-containing protein